QVIELFTSQGFAFVEVIFHLIGGFDIGLHLALFHTSQLGCAKIVFIPFVHDAPNLPYYTIADIKGTIGSHSDPHGTMSGIACIDNGILTGKAVGEYLPRTGGLAVLKGDKANKVASLGIGCTDR